MAIDHHIVQLSREHANAVRAFLRRFYGAGFYGADEKYFEWMYERCPSRWFAPSAAEGKLPINAILTTNGELGAIHAFLPFDARTPWGGEVGIWDIEWINGSGIPGAGRALAKHLLDRVDIYAGFGCNELSEVAFGKMGLSVVPEIPRLVAVLYPDLLQQALASAQIESLAGFTPIPYQGSGRRAYRLGAAADIPDDVLESSAEERGFSPMRSRDWLRWRFDEHPYIDYHVISPDSSGASGVAVVRIEQVAGTSWVVCRVLEMFAEAEMLGKLLQSVLEYARGQGCLIADYFTTSSPEAMAIETVAGEIGIEFHRNPALPFMFQPMEMGKRNSINLIISAGGRAPKYPDMSAFHATKADANQDILRNPGNAPKLKVPAS